MEQCYQTRHNT